jgi:hypothetical protein
VKKNRYHFITFILAMALLTGACTLPTITISMPTATHTAEGEAAATATNAEAAPVSTNAPALLSTTLQPTYASYPGDPPAMLAAVKDEIFPSNYGDNYPINLFERPFQLDNTYRPDADIAASIMSADDEWYYFSTEVIDINPATKMLDTPFGFEIDFDRDGRGDFLLWGTPPLTTNWTNTNVQVFADTNRDVGNRRPMVSDAPVQVRSDGYETTLVSNGVGADPEAAWARQSPLSQTTLQIAVKKSLINKTAFLWWAWTDFDLGNPVQFDYNDFYTAQEAGSPYASNPYHPLKALFGMDNTCRVAFGFTPVGNEPGLCGGVQPTAAATSAPIKTPIQSQNPTNTPIPPQKPTYTPIPPKKPTNTPVPPACMDIQITAQVTDGSKWDPSWASGVTLCIGGDCRNPDSGGYVVWYLPAGTYTIKAASPAFGIHPGSATTTKGCGEKDLIQFVIGPG